MTTQEQLDALIEQAATLPHDAQDELVQSLLMVRFQHLGVYDPDETER
jgi:hypothetical protein